MTGIPRLSLAHRIVESAINLVVSKRLVRTRQMRWAPTGVSVCARRARVLTQ